MRKPMQDAIAEVTDVLRMRWDVLGMDFTPRRGCTFIRATQRVLSDDYVESGSVSMWYPSQSPSGSASSMFSTTS